MKSYFDGSGKYEDPGSRLLTLAGCAADWWEQFERAWDLMLERHGAPYLHMREVVPRVGPFKTWNEQMVNELVADAIETAIDHPPERVKAFSCTLSIAEHRQRAKTSSIPDAYWYCSSICLSDLLRYEGENSRHHDRIELYFDAEDKFFRFWMSVWNRNNKPARGLECIDHLSPIRDQHKVGAMQFADLLA
jgi:hypothetical protein